MEVKNFVQLKTPHRVYGRSHPPFVTITDLKVSNVKAADEQVNIEGYGTVEPG